MSHQRADARKRDLDDPHTFDLARHDTATGQRAIRELAAEAHDLGEHFAAFAAWIDSRAGAWKS